jgi:hypothetical protein
VLQDGRHRVRVDFGNGDLNVGRVTGSRKGPAMSFPSDLVSRGFGPERLNIGRIPMTHIRTISSGQPKKAQFESILQFIGVLSAILALFNNFMDTFGIKQ